MTLLVTVFAAVIATAVWYRDAARAARGDCKHPSTTMRVGMLVWMFWGASLMWLVDAIAEYVKVGADYFAPDPLEMLNDTFLGLSVIALGGVIWVVALLVRDPAGVLRSALLRGDRPDTDDPTQ